MKNSVNFNKNEAFAVSLAIKNLISEIEIMMPEIPEEQFALRNMMKGRIVCLRNAYEKIRKYC